LPLEVQKEAEAFLVCEFIHMRRSVSICFFLLISLSCKEKEYWHFELIDKSGTPYQTIRVNIKRPDRYIHPYTVRINEEVITLCYHDVPDQWVFRVPDALEPGEYNVELWNSREYISTALEVLSVFPLDTQKSWMPYSPGDVVDCGIIVTPDYNPRVNDTLNCILVEEVEYDLVQSTWGYLFDTKNQILYADCSPQLIKAAFNINVGDTIYIEGEGQKSWLTPKDKTDTMITFIYQNGSNSTFVKGVGCIDCDWLLY